MSERTEETSLLPEDEARRLPLDDIIIVVDAQMPIRAKRIKYFDDPFFKSISEAQTGDLPFPETRLATDAAPVTAEPDPEATPKPAQMPEGRAGAEVAEKAERTTADKDASVGLASNQPHRATVKTSARKRKAKAVVQAARDFEDRQGAFDLSIQQRLDIPDPAVVSDTDLEALDVATDELAELEATIADEGQGGEKISAIA